MSAFMDIVRSLAARLGRGRGRTSILVAAVLVPALTAAVLVVALAPALDASSRIPVAVVNLDEGAVDADGRNVQAGSDLVDSLLDSDELAWSEVGASEAEQGLANGTFALILEIPADYSEKVSSLTGSNPEQAQLRIISDGAQNVLATKEGSAVLRQVQARLRSDLGENYLLNVLNNVRSQASTLTLTADGAVMLDSAYDALEQGTSAMAEGLEQTASGTGALAEGVGAIASGVTAAGAGAESLAAGMDATNDQVIAPLATGAEATAAGVAAAGEGIETLGSAVTRTGEGLLKASSELDQSISDLAELSSLAPQFSEHAQTLSDALGSMSDASSSVQAGAEALVGAVGDAQAAVGEAQTDAQALAHTLSSEQGDEGQEGIVQRMEALDAEYEELVHRLTAIANGTFDPSGVTDGLDTLDEVSARIEELELERESLRSELEQAAANAQSLAGKVDSAATSLDGLEGQRQALASAAEEYSQAEQTATGAANDIASLAGQFVEPALRVAVNAQVAKATLDASAPALIETGGLITQTGASLAPDGMLGLGVQGVAAGTAALPQVLDTFSTATTALGQGNVALGQALDAVGAGISGLGEGISVMASAEGQLASGVGQLREGQETINDTLSSAGESLDAASSQAEERAEAASAPVSFTTEARNRVSEPMQVAPIALAVALWLGALLAAVVMPPLDGRVVLAGRALPAVLSGFVVSAGAALVQAIAVALAVIFATGSAPANMPAFCAIVVLAALSFAAIGQGARALCGRAAVPALVFLLALQLVCAGSVLPVSFASGAFEALGTVLPVPQFAEGLRGAMAGPASGAGGACVALTVWLAIGLAATVAAARVRTHIRPERVFVG